jgi:hypothetical protein
MTTQTQFMSEADEKRYEFVLKHLKMFGCFDEGVQGRMLTPGLIDVLIKEGRSVTKYEVERDEFIWKGGSSQAWGVKTEVYHLVQ